jgi:hypothetical protein
MIVIMQVPILSSTSSRKCSSQPFYNVPNMFLNYISNFGLLISALIVLAASVWGEYYAYTIIYNPVTVIAYTLLMIKRLCALAISNNLPVTLYGSCN